jgi:hypothetical protein
MHRSRSLSEAVASSENPDTRSLAPGTRRAPTRGTGLSLTPPGGTAATPKTTTEGMPERQAVPPQRTGLEPLPQRVRGASGVTETVEDPEPVDEETLHRLLAGLREI